MSSDNISIKVKCDLSKLHAYCTAIFELCCEKTAFCICKNKDTDQPRENHAVDQCLCCCYIDPGLCRTWTETYVVAWLILVHFFSKCMCSFLVGLSRFMLRYCETETLPEPLSYHLTCATFICNHGSQLGWGKKSMLMDRYYAPNCRDVFLSNPCEKLLKSRKVNLLHWLILFRMKSPVR